MLREPQHERKIVNDLKTPPFVPSIKLRTGSELIEGLLESFSTACKDLSYPFISSVSGTFRYGGAL
jgi:hypothetical protein